LLCAAGCRGTPYEPGERFADPALRDTLREKMAALYPKSFRAIHRVILTVADRQFDLDGYVLVERPERLRLLAKGGFGGTAFDAVRSRRDGDRVHANPESLREAWIRDGALRDAEALYLLEPGPGAFLVRRGDGAVALARDLPGGVREETIFEGESHRLAALVRARQGDQTYRMVFGAAEPTPGWETPVGFVDKR
jgi:hypothetical protein